MVCKVKTEPKRRSVPVEYEFRITKVEPGHTDGFPPGAAEAMADWFLDLVRRERNADKED